MKIKSLHIEKKMITLLVIVVVVIGGLGFFSGSVYAKHSASNTMSASMSGGQFRMGGATVGNRTFGQRAGAAGNGFSGGQVIAKDDTSITVQGRDGSSKIVFFTTGTPVSKMVAGTSSDLSVGQTVMITGTPNSDGSISASSIEVRRTEAMPMQKAQ